MSKLSLLFISVLALSALGCEQAQPTSAELGSRVTESMSEMRRIEYHVVDEIDDGQFVRWGPIVMDDPDQIAIAVSFAQECEEYRRAPNYHGKIMKMTGIVATYIKNNLIHEATVQFNTSDGTALNYIVLRDDLSAVAMNSRTTRSLDCLRKYAEAYVVKHPEVVQSWPEKK